MFRYNQNKLKSLNVYSLNVYALNQLFLKTILAF